MCKVKSKLEDKVILVLLGKGPIAAQIPDFVPGQKVIIYRGLFAKRVLTVQDSQADWVLMKEIPGKLFKKTNMTYYYYEEGKKEG